VSWWEDYFAEVDTMELDRFGQWFHEEIVLQFNSFPPIVGKAAVLGFLKQFTSGLKRLRHTHGELFLGEGRGAGEAVVTFTRHDDSEINVRGVTTVLRGPDGLFRRMAIFADFSALYPAAA